MDELPPLLQDVSRRVKIYVPHNEKYGVAVFCDELRWRLVARGSDAEVVKSRFSDALRGVIRDRINGNVSVLSLGHGAFSWLNRRSIFVLHGFPNLSDYSLLRALLIAFVTKRFARAAGLVLSNSEITATINSKIFGISSCSVWNPMRSWKAFDRSSRRPWQDAIPRANVILFCGRAIPGKRVYEAVLAFLDSKYASNWEFQIAGPMEDVRLEPYRDRVTALGSLPRSRVQQLMSVSAIFITLNELEPYGLVIQEAAEAGMIIVCAASSGAARELVRLGYPGLFLVELPTIEGVKEQLESAIQLFLS